jgi:hypothetical protein
MEWAISNAIALNHDRNPNRMAQVTAALRYGHDCAIARRSHRPCPPRPDLEKEM